MNDALRKILSTPMDEVGRKMACDIIDACEGGAERYRLGRSICGRDITGYKIGEGRRRVAFFGAHHALENITSNILYAIIYIMSLPEWNECATRAFDRTLMLSKYCYYIFPCVNPDGVELFMHGSTHRLLERRQVAMSSGDWSAWQANARGVDLNHNYDFGFSEYKRVEAERGILPGATKYSGEYAESEPETRSVAAFLRALAPVAVVSLHAQGEEIYAMPSIPLTKRIGARLAAMTGYRLSEPADTACYGGLCDYTGSLGIPSFTYEVGRGKNPLPVSFAPCIFLRIGRSLVALPTLL